VGPRDDVDVGPRDVDMSPGDDDVVKTEISAPAENRTPNFEVRHPRCVSNHSVENEFEKQP
jgi:hypothetical protein